LSYAYDEAMERINKQESGRQDLANQILSWITCARRPLKTTELQHALTLEDGDSELNEGDLVKLYDMIEVCAGLVIVDEESKIIRLVHFTTQEYFQRTKGRWFPAAEKNIAMICVTYLSFTEFETGACDTDDKFEQRQQSNALYDYAACNCGHHAHKALDLKRETRDDKAKFGESFEAAEKAVISFLQTKENVKAATRALLAAKRWCQNFPRKLTALHVTAYFGVGKAAKAVLHGLIPVDLKDTDGRIPLSYAAENGNEAIVTLLLDNGAATELNDTWWGLKLYTTQSFHYEQTQATYSTRQIPECGTSSDPRACDRIRHLPISRTNS
jgi:hypothetical protein